MLFIQYDKYRILDPIKRINGKFEKVSWDQAIDEIASKLIDLKNKGMHYEHDDKLERILPYLKPKS